MHLLPDAWGHRRQIVFADLHFFEWIFQEFTPWGEGWVLVVVLYMSLNVISFKVTCFPSSVSCGEKEST